MNTISKFIAIAAFIFPLSLLNTLEKDEQEIESIDQLVLNALESVLIAEDSKLNQYFDDMEYTQETETQIEGRKFNIQYDLSDNGISTLSQYEYFIINPKKKNETIVQLHHDDCNNQEAAIRWKGNVANRITYKKRNYLIEYNEAGLVRSLTEYKSQNNSNLEKHTFTYTEDEKIESVGSSSFSNSENKKQAKTETSYSYTENKIEIVQTTFLPIGEIDKVEYVTFVVDDLAHTRINYNTNDRSIIESINETVVNENGQIIRRVETIPGQGNTSIDSFEYNEQGQVLKSSSLIATANNIISHKESLYNYNDGNNTGDLHRSNCDQKVSMIHSVYDEDGNLSKTFKQTTF